MCACACVYVCVCAYSPVCMHGARVQWNLRAVWDPGVPVTLKLPVTLNLFMNYVRTVHGYIKTLVTSTESIKMYTCNSIRNIYESGSAK